MKNFQISTIKIEELIDLTNLLRSIKPKPLSYFPSDSYTKKDLESVALRWRETKQRYGKQGKIT